MFESEERRIARRIKDFIKDEKLMSSINIMLRNGHILSIDNYYDMVDFGRINPQDAYVYFGIIGQSSKSIFYYPFLFWYHVVFLTAYLSKLGFYNFEYYMAPATGLKYAAITDFYRKYLTIELVNLDTVANNTGLPKIVSEVLDGKLISGEEELTEDEYLEIRDMFSFQQLFAGHNFDEALAIIMKYYDEGNQSLVKEVARIAMDYYRIFNPYRVCYDMNSWKEVDCSTIT